jgi:hypothetical protein
MHADQLYRGRHLRKPDEAQPLLERPSAVERACVSRANSKFDGHQQFAWHGNL